MADCRADVEQHIYHCKCFSFADQHCLMLFCAENMEGLLLAHHVYRDSVGNRSMYCPAYDPAEIGNLKKSDTE